MQTVLCFIVITIIPLSLRLFKTPRWSPAYLFCVFWWAQFAVCYLLYPKTPWSLMSATFFLICNLAIIIGFAIPYGRRGNQSNQKELQEITDRHSAINRESAKHIILFFIVLGTLYAIFSIRRFGFSVRSFFDVQSLLQMNNQIAVARYGGGLQSTGVVSQLLLSFTYAAPLAGGSYYPYAESKREKVLCMFTFLPEVLVLLSQNLKAGFIACVIFWLAGYLVSNLRINGRVKVSKKTILIVVVIIVAICILLMTTMILRIGAINVRTIQVVQRKFINYLFGHVGAIDDWINTNIFHSDLTLGGQTFIGISRYLGYSQRVQGVYLDNYIGPDLSTNVYTYFRGIYQDYGIVGSILFFLILGIVMGMAYRAVMGRIKGKSFADVVLIITYAFSLYYIVSVFSYASFIIAFILYFIYARITYVSTHRIVVSKYKFVFGKK